MRIGRAIACLCFAWLAWANGTAHAARLPDWAAEIARTAPAPPEGTSDDRARVLFSEDRVIVQRDGSMRVRRRLATQALRADADEIGLGSYYFHGDTEILRSRGWHLPAEGSAKKNRGGAVDLSTDDVFLSDSKVRFIRVRDVDRGSLVFFEFEAVERPVHLVYRAFFLESSPAAVIRFELQVPDGWTTRHDWLRQEGAEPTIDGEARIWELRDLPAPEREPLGESAVDRAPVLLVGISPPDGVDLDVGSPSTWVDLALWYEQLSEDRDDVTSGIVEVTETVLEDVPDEILPRVRALGNEVRDRVRYVAKEIGIGGYRPRHADAVLRRLYGDCKDKGTLLRAMLDAAGIESYPILVHISLRDTVSRMIPTAGAFNHYVIGVPLPDSLEIPDDYAPAVIEAGALGRILIVDTTNEYLSIGYLPGYLAGQTALVVAGDRSALAVIPADDPRAHRIEKHLEATYGSDGAVEIELETQRFGEPAAAARRRYSRSTQDHRDAIERAVHDQWPEARVVDFEVEEETEVGAYREVLTVRVPPGGDTNSWKLFPGATLPIPRVKLGRRESGVVYRHAMELRFETTWHGVPEGVVVPDGRDYQGDGWVAASTTLREGDQVQASWRFELTRLRFAPDAFTDLRDMWSAARRSASRSLQFEP